MEQKIIIIILGTILIILLAFQSAHAAILGYTKPGYPACPSMIDFEKVETFYWQRDFVAVDKMIEQGRCILLSEGIKVYAWNPFYETHRNWIKIRLPGSTETLWTFWEAIEDPEKKLPKEEKPISFAPTLKEKYILLKSLRTIKPHVSRKQDVIKNYGKPFLEDWEELRYETGQHPDFKEWIRVKFIFDESGVLKEIRAVTYLDH